MKALDVTRPPVARGFQKRHATLRAVSIGLALLVFAADASAQQPRMPRGPVAPSVAKPPAPAGPTPSEPTTSLTTRRCKQKAAELGVKGRALELYLIKCRFPNGTGFKNRRS
ncbi:exported protein of unknown function [Beijerinckiaceae bacterium RH AL1]|nr:hypothetical protein [Beijerinckiaceae bacterium]VVB48517.1 exported protein of unknown function [Beijerinckiaceae bacterium RH CH11]VVB48598.1 exported protein of unknown function [Beijerinckiaceae bacterium RH AL8]VVC56434.1 exported protein of unknown function [Beijerinckiaceae bacterium RH AL1]